MSSAALIGMAQNPLTPASHDLLWSAFFVAAFTLLAVALVQLIRARGRLSDSATAVWVLVALAIPILGPLAWLVVGRGTMTAAPVEASSAEA